MKLSAITLTAMLVAFATPSFAQSFDTTGGAGYSPTLPPSTISDETRAQIRAAYEHAGRTWEETRDAGGCNAPVIPYEIAAHCWNYAVGNYPLDGAIGSKGGD